GRCDGSAAVEERELASCTSDAGPCWPVWSLRPGWSLWSGRGCGWRPDAAIPPEKVARCCAALRELVQLKLRWRRLQVDHLLNRGDGNRAAARRHHPCFRPGLSTGECPGDTVAGTLWNARIVRHQWNAERARRELHSDGLLTDVHRPRSTRRRWSDQHLAAGRAPIGIHYRLSHRGGRGVVLREPLSNPGGDRLAADHNRIDRDGYFARRDRPRLDKRSTAGQLPRCRVRGAAAGVVRNQICRERAVRERHGHSAGAHVV